MLITKKYQRFQVLNKGTLGCIYFNFVFTIPPANNPKAKPIIKPILTFLIKKPMATPINTMVKNPIFLRCCIITILKKVIRQYWLIIYTRPDFLQVIDGTAPNLHK
jgi:hypothetical protein